MKSEVVIYFSWSFNFFRFLHFFCCSHVFLTNFLCNYIWSKKPPTSPPVPVFPLQLLHYWTWTKTAPKKRRFYWSNPYKIEVVITSLIEMPQLPNFVHMNTSTYNLNYMITFCWWRHQQKLWCHNRYFKKTWGSQFCWHHQNFNQVY